MAQKIQTRYDRLFNRAGQENESARIPKNQLFIIKYIVLSNFYQTGHSCVKPRVYQALLMIWNCSCNILNFLIYEDIA